ncbi:hypothetical protein [Parvularcula marina]|uniref:hypothetical protein n=1 Tax=Parvularcula marina TaxID=2292771 RepID=UPI0035142BCD
MVRTFLKTGLKSGLLLCTALSAAHAQPFLEGTEEDEEETAIRGGSWFASTNVTATDNYRRLPDVLARFDVDGTTGDITATEVGIEPIENIVISSTIKGSTFVRSKSLTGFVTGTVRVGGYAQSTDDNAELIADTMPAAPYPNMPNADGSFSTFGLAEPDDFFIIPDIVGAATKELSEGRWYLDMSALAQERTLGRPSLINRRGSTPGLDTVTFVGGSLSPYLYREYADQQVLEVRTRASAIFVANERTALGDEVPGVADFSEDDQFANNSLSGELSADYKTGGQFDDASYGVSGYIRHVAEEGSDILPHLYVTEISGRVDAAYMLSSPLKLLAAVGFDDITVNFNDADEAGERRFEEDVNGAFWNVGFRYSPTRKALFELVAGQRYGGPSVEGKVQVQISPRISFNASAERVFDTGGQRFGRALSGLQSRTRTILTTLTEAKDNFAAEFLDDVVDLSLLGEGLDEEFRSGTFVFNQVSASLTAELRRNTIGGGVAYTNAGAGDIDNEAFNLSVFARRKLSRKLSIHASARYGESEGIGVVTDLFGTPIGTGNRESADQMYRAGVDYRLAERISLTSEVYYAKNDSDGPAATRGPGFDFDETAIIFGLRWAF